MEFASEMVIKAALLGQRIAEVPVTLSPDLRDRPPHLRPWRDGWRHLRYLFMLSPIWSFAVPALLVGLCSLLVLMARRAEWIGITAPGGPFGNYWTILGGAGARGQPLAGDARANGPVLRRAVRATVVPAA